MFENRALLGKFCEQLSRAYSGLDSRITRSVWSARVFRRFELFPFGDLLAEREQKKAAEYARTPDALRAIASMHVLRFPVSVALCRPKTPALLTGISQFV
jgi:hypothetical protein